jgi:hypothetical protein
MHTQKRAFAIARPLDCGRGSTVAVPGVVLVFKNSVFTLELVVCSWPRSNNF